MQLCMMWVCESSSLDAVVHGLCAYMHMCDGGRGQPTVFFFLMEETIYFDL